MLFIVQANEEVRLALETDIERLRAELTDASVRTQQMGALEEELASLQEQCQQLQTEKAKAEAEMRVCTVFSNLCSGGNAPQLQRLYRLNTVFALLAMRLRAFPDASHT